MPLQAVTYAVQDEATYTAYKRRTEGQLKTTEEWSRSPAIFTVHHGSTETCPFPTGTVPAEDMVHYHTQRNMNQLGIHAHIQAKLFHRGVVI